MVYDVSNLNAISIIYVASSFYCFSTNTYFFGSLNKFINTTALIICIC